MNGELGAARTTAAEVRVAGDVAVTEDIDAEAGQERVGEVGVVEDVEEGGAEFDVEVFRSG
ncbi:MAG: hypothetical protein ACLQG3_05095 [Terracidiphilus sp.]